MDHETNGMGEASQAEIYRFFLAMRMMDSWALESGKRCATIVPGMASPPELTRLYSHFMHSAGMVQGLATAIVGDDWYSTLCHALSRVAAPYGEWLAGYERSYGWPPKPAVRHWLQEQVEDRFGLLVKPHPGQWLAIPVVLFVHGETYAIAAAAAEQRLVDGVARLGVHFLRRYWILTCDKVETFHDRWPVMAFVEVAAPSSGEAYRQVSDAVSVVFCQPAFDWIFGSAVGQVLKQGAFGAGQIAPGVLPKRHR